MAPAHAAKLSAAEYRTLVSKDGSGRPTKYRNKRTEYAGRTYDSKLEARHAAQLDLRLRAGDIAGWIPQVSIPVPGSSSRMVLDFVVIGLDGSIVWQDTKGAPPTRIWLLKRELVERAYGISIEIVR